MRLTKFWCFSLLVGGRLGVEGDHRQQVLGVREHLLLDHLAQLLVAGPRRVLAVVVGPRAQHEVDDLVAEVLRVADAGGLLDLLELGVQRRAVEALAGVGVAVLLFLDPAVGVGDVAVEDVLAVLRVGLEVGGLDLLADELGVARRQVALDELEVAAARSRRAGPRARSAARARTSGAPGWRRSRVWSKLNTADRILKAKRVDMPVMPSSTPA